MRYADRITFWKKTKCEPNYLLSSDQSTCDAGVGAEVPANVSELGWERSVELFGDQLKRRIVVRMPNAYSEPFDYLIHRETGQDTESQSYRVIASRQGGKVLVGEEVMT